MAFHHGKGRERVPLGHVGLDAPLFERRPHDLAQAVDEHLGEVRSSEDRPEHMDRGSSAVRAFTGVPVKSTRMLEAVPVGETNAVVSALTSATRRSSSEGGLCVHDQFPEKATAGVGVDRTMRSTASRRPAASAAAASSLSTAISWRLGDRSSTFTCWRPTPVMTIRAKAVFTPAISASPPWTTTALTIRSCRRDRATTASD